MAAKMKLGVMALYLNGNKIEEREFFRRLLQEAERKQIEAFLFTPEDVDSASRRIRSHVYRPGQGGWTRRWTSFPHVVFDRCRYQRTPRFRKLREFRAKYGDLIYMNRPMANKWAIHRMLSKDASIRHHLPDTELYRGTESLARFMKTHRRVFIKPVNGTGGRGVVRIEAAGSSLYALHGRDRRRRIIAPRRATLVGIGRTLKQLALTDNCLMQQGIDVTLSNGRVHDYRLLMQKDGEGAWTAAGCAGRVGASRSVTSNLHGGGRAIPMEKLLKHTFPDNEQATKVKDGIFALGHKVVGRLESEFRDMCELALDLAIDRKGGIWLLEINPKPAREVFRRIGEKGTYLRSIARPLEYAEWLYRSKKARPASLPGGDPASR